jgi:hypothetical protein
MKEQPDIVCPSADADWRGAVAFGIIGGTPAGPLAKYLPEPVPVTAELLKLAGPVTPPEVFRFAASCLNSGCVHFQGNACSLASRVVKLLPAVMDRIPRCAIRASCRWWRQEGVAACHRCPQVVTENYHPSAAMREAAQPPVPASQA